METDKGIPILEAAVNSEKTQCAIATNALKTMTDSLVQMESVNIKPEDMMEKCVWPILYEAARRFEAVAKGESDIPKDGFEYVVG